MKKTAEEIKQEIQHVFDSGANEIRVFELLNREVDQYTAPLIEALEEAKKSKWIHIIDSFPENRSYVLIYYHNGYDVAEYKHGCFFIGLTRITGVKYWMPLENPETALLNAKL